MKRVEVLNAKSVENATQNGCGLIKLAPDHTISTFKALKSSLQGTNTVIQGTSAVILINDDLFYTDYHLRTVTKVNVKIDQQDNFIKLKSKFTSSYRLANEDEITLITSLTGHTQQKPREYRLMDGDGLYLRIHRTGGKSWLFRFHLPRERRLLSMTIGSYPEMSLNDARNKKKELREQVKAGIDPRSARAAVIAENSQAITMQVLFDNWIEFVKLASEVSATWIKRHEDRWRLHLKKYLANLLVKDVTRAHLSTALVAMTRKGIKEETRKALTTLNLMLDYGLTRHSIDSNPARLLKPKDFAATANRPRDRVLTIPELRKLWQALDQSNTPCMSIVTTTAIKLLILTGARRSEIAGMCWRELCFKENIWELPPERTKNNQRHVIYLSDLAISLLKSLGPLNGQSQFVFYTGQNHIHKDSLTKSIARLRTAGSAPLKDIEQFSCHDIRRSVATAWGEHLKTLPHVIERMLNHQPLDKLVATYQRAVYATEQSDAWLAWGIMIENHVASESCNIIPIRNAIKANAG